jgi:hypothetical protein
LNSKESITSLSKNLYGFCSKIGSLVKKSGSTLGIHVPPSLAYKGKATHGKVWQHLYYDIKLVEWFEAGLWAPGVGPMKQVT